MPQVIWNDMRLVDKWHTWLSSIFFLLGNRPAYRPNCALPLMGKGVLSWFSDTDSAAMNQWICLSDFRVYYNKSAWLIELKLHLSVYIPLIIKVICWFSTSLSYVLFFILFRTWAGSLLETSKVGKKAGLKNQINNKFYGCLYNHYTIKKRTDSNFNFTVCKKCQKNSISYT